MQEMVDFVTTVRVLVIITFVETLANFRIESSVSSQKLKPGFAKSELVVRTFVLCFSTLIIILPDSAEIRGYHFNPSSGLETRFSILPARTTHRYFSKCASYDIQPHRKNLFKIVIYSPMDIMVMFHHRDQLNIHRELSASFFFQGLNYFLRLSIILYIY